MLDITKHASERYVQRVMGYTDKQDIALYIVQNKDLIHERINKMIQYGEIIFKGKVNNGNFVNVTIHDTWVIFTDRENSRVITLYKISLINSDECFNKLFIEKIKAKIHASSLKLEQLTQKNNDEKNELKIKIEKNKVKIKEFEALIRELKSSNDAYSSVIDTYDAELHIISTEIKHTVENLVSEKIF